MQTLIKHFIRFCLLLFFQVFVLDKIHLHQMITPYIYFIFILWLPFNIRRPLLMLIAFVLGFTLDSFRHHPGFHAAACVLIAYLRPFIINMLIAQDGTEANYDEPSVRSFGGWLPYLIYAMMMVFLHHAWLFLLEAWQFASPSYFIIKTLLSTLLSLVFLVVIEMLFSRKQKFRTNTV